MLVNPLPIFIFALGAYFLVKLRFFFVLHPCRTARIALRGLGSRGAVRSLCLALAGTLGIGNVVGVCVGIIIGGAGSILWMLVSVVFASAVKYAEVVISSDKESAPRTDTESGMYSVIRHTFHRHGGAVAKVYAILLLCLGLAMGAAMQSAGAVTATAQILDTPPALIAVLFVALVLLAIFGGTKIIERITEIAIPLSTLVYITMSITVVFIYRAEIPRVLLQILRGAFDMRACAGGILGFLLSGPLKEGFSRGILSNEAGSGTSSLAHIRSGILNPAAAGLMGIIEVIFDTAILCPLTALAVLLPIKDTSVFSDGVQLVMSAFRISLGSFSEKILLLCILCFAFATVICWYYYFTESFSWLLGKRAEQLTLPIFLAASFVGYLIDSSILVALTDLFLLGLTAITSITLVKSSDRIRFLSERGGVVKLNDKALKRRLGISQGSVSSR